jgi:hypothetical protein
VHLGSEMFWYSLNEYIFLTEASFSNESKLEPGGSNKEKHARHCVDSP